jgi:glycolate oxidase iron-sulfur subunit
VRAALREGTDARWLFGPAMQLGRMVRPLLPRALRNKVPERRAGAMACAYACAQGAAAGNGCVQPAMMPNIDAATARVLDAIGVQTIVAARPAAAARSART